MKGKQCLKKRRIRRGRGQILVLGILLQLCWSISGQKIAKADSASLLCKLHERKDLCRQETGGKMLAFATTIALIVPEELTAGDVNRDGTVTLEDVNLVVSYYYGRENLDSQQKAAADQNEDGIIDIRDANLILSQYKHLNTA